MADKMLKIAGRSKSGLAKPLATDEKGALHTKLSGGIFERLQILSGGSSVTIAPNESYVLPQVDWANESTNAVFYSMVIAEAYPAKDGIYRLEWQAADASGEYEVMTSRRGRILNIGKSSQSDPVTDVLHQTGSYNRLVIKNVGTRNIFLRGALKYNVGSEFNHKFKHIEQNVSAEGIAKPTVGQIPFAANQIVFLTNDGTGDIKFNFNRPVTGLGAFTLKPGESVSQLNIMVDSLHYSSSFGDQPFRVLGVI